MTSGTPLQLVLEREADAALNAALENTAKITDGWPFQRRYERKPEHFLAFVGIAAAQICHRRLPK